MRGGAGNSVTALGHDGGMGSVGAEIGEVVGEVVVEGVGGHVLDAFGCGWWARSSMNLALRGFVG